MPTPLEFMRRYRNLSVNVVVEDPVARLSRTTVLHAQLKKYFMMDWEAGSNERNDYDAVTAGGAHKRVVPGEPRADPVGGNGQGRAAGL